jgi:hypothetical protein
MEQINTIPECGETPRDSWKRLRGVLKDVLAEYGGGDAYLRAERSKFESRDIRQKIDSQSD